MSTLADRIKEAMEGAQLRPADLARATKKTSGAIAMWLGGSIKSLKAESAAALESATGYSADWIVTGRLPKRREHLFRNSASTEAVWENLDPEDTPEDPDPMRVRLPVVGTIRFVDDEGAYEEVAYPADRPDGRLDGYSHDPDAYALRVVGDGLRPALREGQYIVAEPKSRYEPGEYVIIALEDGQRMIKEFMFERSGSVTVLSVNTGKRSTYEHAKIAYMHPIVAEVSASRWHPAE
jgi:phage repressor protein C with HTH and peptisase S24 domain